MDREALLRQMDWNQPEKIQQMAVERAKVDSELAFWIQPGYFKITWENCAEVVSCHTDEELVPYLMQLLEWLQDLNWPGAVRIQQRLRQMKSELLRPSLKEAMRKAEMQGEEQWLEWLTELANI